MLNKKLIIAASIRNIEKVSKPIFDNLILLSKQFIHTKCILVESDSTDSTKSILSMYKKTLPFDLEVYSFGATLNNIPNRMQRISMCRNFYVNLIKTQYSDYDFLYVLDFNDTNIEPYDIESFMSNFDIQDWDMVCANQEKGYYDLYALRHETWMPFNCWNAIGNRPTFMSYKEAHNMYVKSRFLKIDKTHPPIKVISAFGGSAFIKISSLIRSDAKHTALDSNNEEECEWVSFCKDIGNVFINPKFINMKNINRHITLALME